MAFMIEDQVKLLKVIQRLDSIKYPYSIRYWALKNC